MKTRLIKIACLEDSEFYNMLLVRYLHSYIEPLAEYLGCEVEILSFSTPQDFLRNMSHDTHIALIDYYLGSCANAEQVIPKMRKQGFAGKIILMSQVEDERIQSRCFRAGASEFIIKNRHALQRAAMVVESMMQAYLRAG